MTNKFYTCRADKAFKELFMNKKNEKLLKVLLETVLRLEIKKIEYLNLEDLVDNIEVRKKSYDLRLDTNIGRIQVEVNSNIYDYSRTRQVAYLCNEYSHITLSGKTYDEETKVIQINFTYGLMKDFEEKYKFLYDDKDYRIYQIRDETSKLYVNNFKIYEINMDYYMKFWYDKNEEKIDEYKYIIMMDLTRENLLELSKKDRMVKKYMEELERINRDPKFIEYMSDEEDLKKRENTMIKRAREEGIEKGKNNRNIEIAKKMKEENIDIAIIVNCTGLSKCEIEKL